MRHFSYLSMMFILLAGLICCDTETGSGSGSSPVEPVSPSSATVYSVSNVKFDSLSYILTADTDASDDKVFTMTVNNQSVTAKANKGRLSADLSKCWTNANKGGKQYEVTFSVANAGVNPSKVNIDYWPKAVCELKCASEIAIYNGSTSAYQSPQFTLNYEADTYDYTMSFIVKDSLDNDITRTIPGIATWQLSNMLTYLKETDHFGYSVKVTATITPKRNGTPQTDLQCKVSVTYISCKDVLAAKVRVEHYYNYYIAVPYDKDDNPAGGNIQYEWQVSENKNDSWLDMVETSNVLEITKDNVGKYIRCVITQNYEGESRASIIAEAVMINNIISEAYLHYGEVVEYGDNPILEGITGTAVDVFGSDVKGLTFGWDNLGAGMKSSDYMSVKISKDGFEDYIGRVFVTVQNVLADKDVIPLSTNTRNISPNKVKFSSTSSDIECSFDNGTTWKAIPANEFDAAIGDVILLRRKEVGTPNQSGYIMASNPKSLVVSESNRGQVSYTLGSASYNAETNIISIPINAPNGSVFEVDLNNHSANVYVSEGKLAIDAASFFSENDECGKTYTVDVTADYAKVEPSRTTVSYWPKAAVTLESDQYVVIWTGNERYLVPDPSYSLNYGNDNCNITITYDVSYFADNDGEKPNVTTTNWTIDDMIDYIFDNEHTGEVVETHFRAVPKNAPAQSNLAVEWTMTYDHRRDEPIKSAEIVKKYNNETNSYYFAITAYNSTDDETKSEAGGTLDYSWEIADSTDGTFSAVTDDPTGMIHLLKQDELGKYLRCTVIQTYEDQTQDPVTTAPININSVLKTSSLAFDAVITEGSIPSKSNLSGSAVSIYDDTETLTSADMDFTTEVDKVTYTSGDSQYTISVPDYLTNGLSYSMIVPVKITKDGYDTTYDTVFVTVQSVMTEQPSLVTDVWTVTSGKVKFDGDYLALEYKVNDADEWKTVTSKEFDAQTADTVHIRKKSSGVEGKHGYVKESAEITLTVAAENIGKRAETEQGMEVEITNVSLKLTQTLDGNRIKVTAALENTSGIEYFGSLSYDYTWRVDGFIADNLNYAEVNNNVLYLDQSQMASGETYQVSAFVEIHYKTTIPKNDIVLMKEQKQLSVTVQ